MSNSLWTGAPRVARCVTSLRALTAAAAAAFAFLVALPPASAQETVSYTYDAAGRLVQANHGATGPNANVSATYTYDDADNRKQVLLNTTTGASTLTLTPTTLPGGTVAAGYSRTITATGGIGGYTFASSGSLPAGLTLSSAGVVSGAPTTIGTYTFTATATDSLKNSGSRSYTVTIGAANDLSFSPATLPNGGVSTDYSSGITASGGTAPYTFTITSGTLPPGLTLSSGGSLSGTPTTAGTYNFAVHASDSGSNHLGSKSYSLVINPSGPVANPDSASTTVCGTVSVDVIANDTGVAPLTLTAIVSSTKGTAKVVGTTNVSFTAFAGTGQGLVTYTVSDGHGVTANGMLGVVISGGVCP